MTPPWYVITGGPCAGKSTLIRELQLLGYETVPEAARAVIDAGLGRGESLADIRKDAIAFQREVLRQKVRTESTLSKDKVLFFDRGMHDTIAYVEYAGVANDPEVEAAVAQASYRMAFLPDLLPLEQDAARTETAEEAAALHEMLARSYESAGIPVVRVPALPVPERVAFILERVAGKV